MAYGDGAYGQTAYASPTGGIRVYNMEGNIILETSIPNLPEATYAGSGAIDIEAITEADLTILKKAVFSTSIAFGHRAEIKRVRFGDNTVTLELDFQGSLGSKCSITIEAELTAVTEIVKRASGTIQLVAETLLEPTKKISALSSTALDYELEGINIRQRDSDSSVEIEVNTSMIPSAKLGGEVGVTLNLTPDITETRIRDAIFTIETTFSVLETVTALRQGSSSTGIGFDIEGIDVRQTPGNSSVNIEVELSPVPTQIITPEGSITLELDSTATAKRIRGMVGAIEIAQNILAQPTAIFTSGANIELSLDTLADFRVILSASSDIQIVLEPDATALGTELLLEFTGSLASGDSIEINSENFLITDPSTGENLRPDFEIGSWPDIGPNGATLRWKDPETGRTIELKIEKRDRSV